MWIFFVHNDYQHITVTQYQLPQPVIVPQRVTTDQITSQ